MARILMLVGCIALVAVGFAAPASRPAASSRPALSRQDLIERGRYITEHVAMCIQCHTPRDEQGNLDRTQLFHGAPIPVRSPWPNQEWAYRSAHIAGLPGWSEEEGIKFLQYGKDPRGRVPLPPMPPFRMNREDAQAVVAFLKSID